MDEPAKIRIPIKEVYLETTEDNKGAIIFLDELGRRFALMQQDDDETIPLVLRELVDDFTPSLPDHNSKLFCHHGFLNGNCLYSYCKHYSSHKE